MNFLSIKITNEFQDILKKKLLADNFIFSSCQNAKWKATNEGINVTCYESLKLLIQGKKCEEFNNKYLKNNSLSEVKQPTLIDTKDFVHDFSSWIGTDESGKGDFIGPLVTAGVLVKKEQIEFLQNLNIKDSKKLTDKFIIQVAPKIKQNCLFSVVTINPEKYNELYAKFKNLNKLLAWAHSRAIENLLEKSPDCENAISDKFADESLIKNALFKKGKKINLIQRTKAESDIAVACASILAREEFVKRTENLKKLYNIDFSKGGGDLATKQAQEFAKQHGKDKLKLIAKMHFKNMNQIN